MALRAEYLNSGANGTGCSAEWREAIRALLETVIPPVFGKRSFTDIAVTKTGFSFVSCPFFLFPNGPAAHDIPAAVKREMPLRDSGKNKRLNVKAEAAG